MSSWWEQELGKSIITITGTITNILCHTKKWSRESDDQISFLLVASFCTCGQIWFYLWQVVDEEITPVRTRNRATDSWKNFCYWLILIELFNEVKHSTKGKLLSALSIISNCPNSFWPPPSVKWELWGTVLFSGPMFTINKNMPWNILHPSSIVSS